MVELIKSMKRKRVQKTVFDKSSRYPLGFQFSSLTYKQAPVSLALSSQNILVSTSTRPHPHQTSTVTGDIYHLEAPVRRKVIQQVKDYHKQHTITHLEWHPKGTLLASVDEVGHLALWKMKSSVHDWSMIYKEDLKQPLVAFLWFPSDRMYLFDEAHQLKRDVFHGPRNPYGPSSFLTVTLHGLVRVHYQQSTHRFGQFSTTLPSTQRRKMREAGCYSMTLAGLESWERLSHASLVLKQDQVYLAAYNHKTVLLYTLDIQFPKKINDHTHPGRIACRLLTSLQSFQREQCHVTQLVLLPSLTLVVGMGQSDGAGFNSCLASWTLQTVNKTITNPLGTLQSKESALVPQSSLEIQGRFITAFRSLSREWVIGLSDGSVYRTDGQVLGSCLVEPVQECVMEMVISPNQTHLIYQLSSMKLGVIPLRETVEDLAQQFELCLHNRRDYLDLVSYLIRTHTEDQVDTVLHQVLRDYQQQIGVDLADWSLAQLEKPYGLAMAIYRRIPSRQVQFVHFSRAIQFPLMLECFISSCLCSPESDVFAEKTVEFDQDSIWSLVSLSGWIFDYLQWILREWYLLFHRITPSQSIESQAPVHAALLLHPETRRCLVKILKLIQQFIQFSQSTTSTTMATESRTLLQRYTTALQNHEAIVLSEAIEFLQALDSFSLSDQDPWSLLIYSNLKAYPMADIKAVSDRFKHKCAKPWVYIQKADLYPFDVVCKRRIGHQVKTVCCMRCQQDVLCTLEQQDPCASVQWYQSLKGYHCICGGLLT